MTKFVTAKALSYNDLMQSHRSFTSLVITNAVLTLAFILTLLTGRSEISFVAGSMLVVSIMPLYLKSRHDVHIPIVFVYIAIMFIFASVGLGEQQRFYDLFYWYDAFLHFISALIFGIIGFLTIYIFYVVNRLKVPHWLLVLFAFTFAVSIGTLWEIIEFTIDKSLGANMQLGSLDDTMWDLVIDTAGAFLASLSGYIYLKIKTLPVLGSVVNVITKEVVEENALTVKDII